MLLAAAKQLGADKVVDIKVDITPDDGIWTLRKVLGWRTARGQRRRGRRRGRRSPGQNAPALAK